MASRLANDAVQQDQQYTNTNINNGHDGHGLHHNGGHNNVNNGNSNGAGGLFHHAKPHQSLASNVTNPMSRPANPGPLGLISFALTTFVLGLYQCGAGLPHSNPLGSVGPDQAVFGLAVFFGGTAQFIAGIFEFTVGNTLGTTIHCSYGAFWLAFAMFLVPSLGIQSAYAGDMRAYSFALGIFLLLWCFLTLIFIVAALKTNIAILVVLSCLAPAFFFLSLAQFVSTSHAHAAKGLNQTGGAFAIICAAAAFYAGASGIMQPETTSVRLPVGEFRAYKNKLSEKHGNHQA